MDSTLSGKVASGIHRALEASLSMFRGVFDSQITYNAAHFLMWGLPLLCYESKEST